MNNKALQTLFIFNGLFVFGGSLLGPLYAVFAKTIDASISSISISWAAFLLSTTIFMLFVRKYGDRVVEKEYLLMSGYLVRAIVWFCFPYISTTFMLIVLQILLGIGEALGTPAFDAIFAEHLDKHRHIEEYTDWKLVMSFSNAIAILIGGFIVEAYGFQPLFAIMGTLALVSLGGVFIQPRKLL